MAQENAHLLSALSNLDNSIDIQWGRMDRMQRSLDEHAERLDDLAFRIDTSLARLDALLARGPLIWPGM